MANVYFCGAETLALPLSTDIDFNAFRWNLITSFLTLEISALYTSAKFITRLAYDPTSSIAPFFTKIWGNVIPVPPNAIQHPAIIISQVAPVDAITIFAADMIFNLGGGATPDPIQTAAIATLQAKALGAGILWRDAANIGLTPVEFRPIVIPRNQVV